MAPTESSGGSSHSRKPRERQILVAAKEVFAERGYHEASINDIIRRAGIARGTFYLYFEGKHKVFDAILDEALDELRARITRVDVSDGAEAPQVQLRRSLIRVMDFMLGDRHLVRLLFSHGLALDAEVAERVKSFYDHVHMLVNRSLEVGLEIGLVRKCDAGIVASALVGAVRGVIESTVGADSPPASDAIVDELIAFALGGVIAPNFGR